LEPLFKNKRSRTIAKGGGLYSICKTVRADLGVGRTVVRNHVDIDTRHSRAIVREIGERLRSSLKEDRELPANFRMQIERLRQSEQQALAALDPAQSVTRQHRKSEFGRTQGMTKNSPPPGRLFPYHLALWPSSHIANYPPRDGSEPNALPDQSLSLPRTHVRLKNGSARPARRRWANRDLPGIMSTKSREVGRSLAASATGQR
jgi:hypothetical protein